MLKAPYDRKLNIHIRFTIKYLPVPGKSLSVFQIFLCVEQVVACNIFRFLALHKL